MAFNIHQYQISFLFFFFSFSFFQSSEKTGVQKLLTKGDNNMVDDRGLYNYERSSSPQLWIEDKDIVGRVQGFVPYVGMVVSHILCEVSIKLL